MWPGWTFYNLISFVLSGALREKTLNSVFLYKPLIQIFITQFEWGWFYLFILVDFFSPALTRIFSGLSKCICPLLFAKSKWNAVLCLLIQSPCSTTRASELWEHSPLADMQSRPTKGVFLLEYVPPSSSSVVYQSDNNSFLNIPRRGFLGFIVCFFQHRAGNYPSQTPGITSWTEE